MTADIQGFVAWCDEFVHQVMDHNGTTMTTELDEQLGILRASTEFKGLEIPDLKGDEDVVKLIDELKYRLKPAFRTESPIALALNTALNRIIIDHKLDDDPHTFATMPKEQAYCLHGVRKTEECIICAGLPEPRPRQWLFDLGSPVRRCMTCGVELGMEHTEDCEKYHNPQDPTGDTE